MTLSVFATLVGIAAFLPPPPLALSAAVTRFLPRIEEDDVGEDEDEVEDEGEKAEEDEEPSNDE